jgi:hypothetical protein
LTHRTHEFASRRRQHSRRAPRRRPQPFPAAPEMGRGRHHVRGRQTGMSAPLARMSAISGIRHRRSDRAIFKPDRRPLMRFSSLSALAGPRRAGRGCRVPADAASWLQVAVCSTLRLSALRVALGSVRHVTTVKCSPRCSTVLPHWPPLWEKRPLNARRRHQSCGRFVVISRRRLANHVGLSQDRVCRP